MNAIAERCRGLSEREKAKVCLYILGAMECLSDFEEDKEKTEFYFRYLEQAVTLAEREGERDKERIRRQMVAGYEEVGM